MKNTKLGLVSSLLLALGATACKSSSGSGPATRYDSAEAAVTALVNALRSNDLDAAAEILGSGSQEVLHSGDDVGDRAHIAEFIEAYDARHHLVPAPDGGMNLVVGNDDWPMPIPVVEDGGRWSFDTEAGADELLSRRIGRNELDVVQVCLAIVDAQREYAASDPDGDGVQEYATKFLSEEGKRDGLFWPQRPGEPASPLGPLVAEAVERGYGRNAAQTTGPRPYCGYYFRILQSQGPSADGGEFDYVANGHMIGGFAVVAYPAEYANSGIMTFMVNHRGVVFQKDLGDDTATKARGFTTFSPGAGWEAVK